MYQIVNLQVSRSTFWRTTRLTTNEPDSSRVRKTDARPGALRGSSSAQRSSPLIFLDQKRPVSSDSSSSNLKNFESTLKGIVGMHL